MQRNILIFVCGIFLASFFCSACSHDLKVKNLHKYSARMPYFEEPITIGVNTVASGAQEQIFDHILDEFRTINNIRVIYPYVYSEKRPVDYIVEITPDATYKGSWVNYFITFPGFLIFTPAWNGLNYTTDIYTDITIQDYNTKETVWRDKPRTKYKCKHAEIDRTWTTGCDWLLTLGLTSFFGGFYFISYDDDITEELNYSIARAYGSYIARKIAGQLQARQNYNLSAVKSEN